MNSSSQMEVEIINVAELFRFRSAPGSRTLSWCEQVGSSNLVFA